MLILLLRADVASGGGVFFGFCRNDFTYANIVHARIASAGVAGAGDGVVTGVEASLSYGCVMVEYLLITIFM